MKVSRRRQSALMTVLLLIAAPIVFFPRWASAAGRWLDVGDADVDADVAFVLGGDIQTRLPHAARLHRDGAVRKIAVMTMPPMALQASDEAPTDATAIAMLRVCGVADADLIRLDVGINSTYDEAVVIADYRRDHPDRSIVVITNDYHTRRARWIVHRACDAAGIGDQADTIQFSSAQTRGYDADNWFRNEDGFEVYAGEWVKTIGYRVLYAPMTTAACVAGLLFIVMLPWLRRRRHRKRLPARSRTSPNS